MAADCVNQRPEEYITEQGLHKRYLIPPRTAQRWRQDGTGPQFCQTWTAENHLSRQRCRSGWPPERSPIVPTNWLDAGAGSRHVDGLEQAHPEEALT